MDPEEFLEECKKIYHKMTEKEIDDLVVWMRDAAKKEVSPEVYREDPYSYDPEEAHSGYDSLMEKVLKELGYGDGIDYVHKTVKATMWYA